MCTLGGDGKGVYMGCWEAELGKEVESVEGRGKKGLGMERVREWE